MKFDAAQRLAGLLYGNILHRDADTDGYNFYVKKLSSSDNSISDLITEFYTSDEFCQKFVVNQTPNELARNLLGSFFNPTVVTAKDVSTIRDRLINQGLPKVIAGLIEDHRFFDRHGVLGVPRYEENSQIMV